MDQIRQIVKRDGRTVDFNIDKITEAIYRAAKVLGGKDHDMAQYLARQVELYLLEICHNDIPTVEQIQDAVERCLSKTDTPGQQRSISCTEQNVPVSGT